MGDAIGQTDADEPIAGEEESGFGRNRFIGGLHPLQVTEIILRNPLRPTHDPNKIRL